LISGRSLRPATTDTKEANIQSEGMIHIRCFVEVTIAGAPAIPRAQSPRRKQAKRPSGSAAERTRKRAVSPKQPGTDQTARPGKRTTGVFALEVDQ
jgi:hypothetical protein